MADLSVIILSYNTKEITLQCIQSLLNSLSNLKKYSSEVIVVDNNSEDGSQEEIKKLPVKTLFLKENYGFGVSNNKALDLAKGKYTLYLNSDVLHNNVNYDDLLDLFESDKKLGALTVKVMLENGEIDPASHRGFPTVWRSFTYFSKLEKITYNIPGLNKLFGGYHLAGEDLEKEHEIESPSGAYFLARTDILKKLKGFDEDFFMYGEDLDLAFRIKELGYKIFYIPFYSVTHLKYRSGIKKNDSDIRKKIRGHFYKSMEIFYNKHYKRQNPGFINALVHQAIRFISR